MNARHPQLLRAEQTLLLVIDMQEPFLRKIQRSRDLYRHVDLLLDIARILEIPVIATVQYSDRMGGIVPRVYQKLPSVSRPPLDKLCFSCSGDEEIAARIAESGRKQILICGVETHICVSQTALDLLTASYQVHVAADSVSARSESTHQIGLDRMRRAGVTVTSAEAAIYELLYQAGTPQFKEALRLIKEAES